MNSGFPSEEEDARRLQSLKGCGAASTCLIEVYPRSFANYTTFPEEGSPIGAEVFLAKKTPDGEWSLFLLKGEEELDPGLSYTTWGELCDGLVWQNAKKKKTACPPYGIWSFISDTADEQAA